MKHLIATTALALLAASPALSASTANPHALNSQDRQFIAEVESGNLAEATLGQLAEQRAAKPAVKEFGRWMAADHALANKQLMAIARDANDHHQPMLMEKDTALQAKLQPLSGAGFDKAYLKSMVEDHQKTIELFHAEAQSGEYQQLKTYAQNLLPVLEQHLAEAQQLAGASGVSESMGSSIPPKPHKAQ